MLNSLIQKNPDIKIYDVNDEEFLRYGRVIKDFDASSIISVAKNIEYPEKNARYLPSVKEFESLPAAMLIGDKFFGEGNTQVGYCWGKNNLFGATEWHTSSEINIAVTPLIIIVGHIWQIENNTIDTSCFKAFFVPAGTVLECYATTLHYCPCQVLPQGFGWVVALPKGTNTPLKNKPADKLLWETNKWLISHKDSCELVSQGAFVGCTGTNYEIKY